MIDKVARQQMTLQEKYGEKFADLLDRFERSEKGIGCDCIFCFAERELSHSDLKRFEQWLDDQGIELVPSSDACLEGECIGPETQDELDDRISKCIRRYGWQLQGVMGDEDNFPFIYSIGNQEVGLPELLMIGSHRDGSALNALCKIMRENNRPFENGELIDWGGKFPLKSINAGDEAKDKYTLFVGAYYRTDEYAVQQVLMPDRFGRYPDDLRCEYPYCLVPVLTTH